MKIIISETNKELGQRAAAYAAQVLNRCMEEKGCARLLLSTGQSQFDVLEALVKENVDWSRVEMFHLDEYVGLPEDHPASFVKYLRERVLSRVPMKQAHLIPGDEEPDAVIERLTQEIRQEPIDLALIGIGENAHIAFNDPPADFSTKEAFEIVTLDEKCKGQQVGEGWFATKDDVPDQAVSITVHQIMQSKIIVSCVPFDVKAEAVKDMLYSEVTNQIPATVLKTHPQFYLFLDEGSAALIDTEDLMVKEHLVK